MISVTQQRLLVGATVASGLLAGLYYGWSCSVMPGLGNVSDAAFAESMTAMNQSIQNPVFFASFFGAPLLTGAAWNARRDDRWLQWALGLSAASFLITVAANVPLNEAFDADKDRAAFEDPWVLFHSLRTVVSVGAFACLVKVLRRT